MATEVGTAYVSLVPSARGFASKMQAAIGGDVATAGSVGGKQYGDKFAATAGSQVSGRAKSVFSGLAKAAFAAFASGAVIRGANVLVGKASDLNETVNKSNIIFGKQSQQIARWASTASTSFGLSEQAALASASSFGDMFRQIGFAGNESARMSKHTVQMAADLGSFNNLDTSDVLDRISASLRGEFDSLQAVIPNINAARVQQEALAATGKKSAEALTAQEKAAATLAIIQRDGARAMGDYGRTQNSLANSSKTVRAQFEDLKTRIGTGLLPIWESVSNTLKDRVMPQLALLADEWVPKISNAISGWLASGDPSAMFKSLGDAVSGIDFASLGSSLGQLGSSFAELGPSLAQIGTDTASDTISVFATVVGFAAEHTDLLAKALPVLLAGFVAYKAAQAAANVVALASVPIKIAEVASNVALARSNKALVASRAQAAAATTAETTAVGANTAAQNVGILTRVRSTAATIASTVAQKAAAVAARAWAATQWLLNAAMTANPIGLVVVAIAALVGGLILAYKKSETFRNIVNGAFSAVMSVVRPVIEWFRNAIPQVFAFVVNAVRTYINIYRTIIVTVFNVVRRVVSTVIGVVRKVITTAWRFVSTVVRTYLNTYRTVIVTAFNAVKGAVSRVMSAVRSVVTSVWNGVTNTVRNAGGKIVDGVRAIPGKLLALGGKFADVGRSIIGKFVDGLRGAGGLVSDIAGNVWGAVKGLINNAIDKLNSALEFTINLPGPDVHINPPNINHLATGGRAYGATLALIGEGREAETVFPDSTLAGFLERMTSAAVSSLGGAGGSRRVALVLADGTQLDAYIDERIDSARALTSEQRRAGVAI